MLVELIYGTYQGPKSGALMRVRKVVAGCASVRYLAIERAPRGGGSGEAEVLGRQGTGKNQSERLGDNGRLRQTWFGFVEVNPTIGPVRRDHTSRRGLRATWSVGVMPGSS